MKLNIKSLSDIGPLHVVELKSTHPLDGDRCVGFMPIASGFQRSSLIFSGVSLDLKQSATLIGFGKTDTRSLLVQREESLNDD
jgi:hypothetical protein